MLFHEIFVGSVILWNLKEIGVIYPFIFFISKLHKHPRKSPFHYYEMTMVRTLD